MSPGLRGVRATWLLLGCMIGALFATLLPRTSMIQGERHILVLKSDLDLEKAYFFHTVGARPGVMRGVLKAGTEIEVTWKQGRAVYISMSTVVDETVLQAVATDKKSPLSR